MMETLRIIIESLSCFLELGLGLYLFSSNRQRRFEKKETSILFIILSSIYALGLHFIGNDIVLFVFSIAITAALSLLYKYKWYVGILLSIIFSVISGISELIVMQATVMISGEVFETANNSIYTYIIGLLATKMFTFSVITIIRKGRHKSFQGIGNARFTQLMLLPLATVVIAIIFSTYIDLVATNFIKIASIAALLILVVANAMTFYIVDAQHELISAKHKLKASQLLLENQRQYYDDIFRSHQEIRKTRHDLKNIFIAVLGELNDGNVEATKEMIKKKLNEIEETINLSNKQSSVVDAVIYAKECEANKQNIELKSQISINRHIYIDNLDLAVLTANILDNAIEAVNLVEDNRFIEFSFITENDNLIVFCKNPTINNTSVDKIRTTKKDATKHGFGIMSIRAIAEKYNGSYVIECDNGFFSGTAIMVNRNIHKLESFH